MFKIDKKLLTTFLIIVYLISFIYNNKLYLLILLLHYKKTVPWFSEKSMDKKKIQKENTEWMSYLNDSIDIRQLSIPGTHDSCASEFICKPYQLWWANFMSQCQIWPIEDQLFSGIRYFDLRPSGNGIIYHGAHQTKYNFKQIFEIYKNFLLNHPSEGLIVRVQFQYKNCGDNIDKSKEKAIYEVLDHYDEFLYRDNNAPTIGQLRKKIYVILENLEYKNLLIWNDNDLIELQDYFRLFGIRKFEFDKKKDLVRKYMHNKDINKLIINHCSAIGRGVLTTLKYVAYCINEAPFKENGLRGIFALDFPGEELINHIINQNKLQNILENKLENKLYD